MKKRVAEAPSKTSFVPLSGNPPDGGGGNGED